MKNRLPKYWIVKNDGSQLFKDTVLKHLDLIDKDSTVSKWIDYATYDYYGFDGNEEYSGTQGSSYIDNFINTPTLLTLEEFIELSKPIEKWIPKIGDKVKIPKTKSIFGALENSNVIKNVKEKSQNFLFYNGLGVDGDHMFSDVRENNGDYFLLSEIEPYEETDTSILPEKWCIQQSLSEEVCKWFSNFYFTSTAWTGGSYKYLCCNESFTEKDKTNFSNKFPEGYIEITVEQFKEHVLKEKKTMQRELKIGDTVKIIDTKVLNSKVKVGDLATIVSIRGTNASIEMITGELNGDSQILYHTDQVELVETKQEPKMKNLLEEEFYITNCTLAQRLAIKAYCDEKNIKYYEGSFTGDMSLINHPNIKWRLNTEEFVGTNNTTCKIVTFKEVIQALEDYEVKPKFKVGDYVIAKGYNLVGEGNGFRDKQIAKLEEVGINQASGSLREESNFSINVDNCQYNIKTSHIERLATPEEIAKCKEKNDIKLPKIAGYDGKLDSTNISWGCQSISIGAYKQLRKLSVFELKLDNATITSQNFRDIDKFLKSKGLM